MIEAGSDRRRQLTIGWFHPGVLARPSSAVAAEQRGKLDSVDRTARGLILASLVTICSVADRKEIREPRTERHEDDMGDTTRGWRRIHIVPEGDPPDKDALNLMRQTIGSVSLGMNEAAYREAQEGRSEGNPFVEQLLNNIADAGFQNPQSLLSFAPVIAQAIENTIRTETPGRREFAMDEFAGAVALY